MSKPARHSHQRARPTATSSPTSGTGGFWRLVGNSESINGMPNGIFGIALALGAALVVYPVARLVRWFVHR